MVLYKHSCGVLVICKLWRFSCVFYHYFRVVIPDWLLPWFGLDDVELIMGGATG